MCAHSTCVVNVHVWINSWSESVYVCAGGEQTCEHLHLCPFHTSSGQQQWRRGTLVTDSSSSFHLLSLLYQAPFLAKLIIAPILNPPPPLQHLCDVLLRPH